MDPASWDDSTAEVYGPAPRHGIRLELRLGGEDLRTLNAAADQAEMPLSRYIVQAALKTAKRAQETVPGHGTSRDVA